MNNRLLLLKKKKEKYIIGYPGFGERGSPIYKTQV